jgi:hypothetical protein
VDAETTRPRNSIAWASPFTQTLRRIGMIKY